MQLIQHLETRLDKLETNEKTYDLISGFVEKINNVLSPTEQAMIFESNEHDWIEQIEILKEELEHSKKVK